MNYYFYQGVAYPDDGYVNIPKNAVLIPENHWFLTIESIPFGKEIKTDDHGLPVLVDFEDKRDIKERCRDKLSTLNARADELLSEITSTYPQHEVESWPEQIREASLLKENINNESYLLREIAQQRGIELEVLRDKVIEKARSYAEISGRILGERQRIEDLLNKADTVEELDNIDITISI